MITYPKRNFTLLHKEKIENEESSGQTKDSTNSILGKKIKRTEEKFANNEYCSICNKEGYLVFCDNCPRSFHFECLHIKESDLPDGDWYCPICAPSKKKIIDEGDKNEKERKRLIKNEKRRLWRRKKKEELEQLKKMKKNLYLDEFVYGTSNGILNKVTKCSNSYQDTINRMMKLPFNNSKICFNITYSKSIGDNQQQNKSLSLPLLFPIPNKLLMNFDTKNKALQDALNKRKSTKIISEKINESFDKIIPEDIINTKIHNTNLNQDLIISKKKLDLKDNNNCNYNINAKEEVNQILKTPNSIQYLNNIIKTNKDFYRYNSVARDYWNIILEKKNSSGNKHIIKYPINDKELYSFPDLHGLEEKYYNKPMGVIYPYFNGKIFSRLINIYDFISTFAPKIYLTKFSLEELYSLLMLSENYKKSEISLLSAIHISLIYLLFFELTEMQMQDINNNSEIEILLIKIIIEFKKNDLKTLYSFIYQTWPELIRLIILSNTFNKSYYTDYKDENDEIILEKIEKCNDIISYNSILNFEEKILVLEKLVMICCSTNYVRSQIKESQEKKIEMKKQEKDLEEELKEIENIKKDLEREYQIMQPHQKIDKINEQIKQLYYEKYSKTQLNKMKNKLEQEKVQFQNCINELENATSRKDEIEAKIIKSKEELNEIPIISKKCLGKDGRGFKYYYFPWMENRIFIRINLNNNNKKYNKYEWRIMENEIEIKDLINKLSEKGIQENELKNKLTLITKNHSKSLKNIDNNHLTIDEIFNKKVLKYENLKSPLRYEKNYKSYFLTSNINQYENIAEKIKKMETLITNHLKQDCKQYESIANRTKIKNWIPTIDKIQNFVSLLLFFNERIKIPYKEEENIPENNNNIIIPKSKKILNDDESSNEAQTSNNTGPLNKNGDFNYEFINRKLQWANRIKLWCKAFEGYNLEKIYLEYLKGTNSFPRLIICINMFDIILSELSRRKEFYRKKNDDNNLDDNKNKNNNSNDENSDVIENSTRRKTLIKKKKLIDWNVKCMYCHEFGDLLCCEDCPNVAHLSCAKLTKEPEVWRCVYCSHKKNNM